MFFSVYYLKKIVFYSITLSLSVLIQPTNKLYPKAKTMAPVNNPIKPNKTNPPKTPTNITAIGTGAPLPNKSGVRILSESVTNKSKTDHNIAAKGSFTEKK